MGTCRSSVFYLNVKGTHAQDYGLILNCSINVVISYRIGRFNSWLPIVTFHHVTQHSLPSVSPQLSTHGSQCIYNTPLILAT